MKKKILSALLVGAMVSSLLAGCGGSDSASTSDNSTSAGSSDAQTTEQGSSDATAEASGIEGKTVAFIPKLTGNAFFDFAMSRDYYAKQDTANQALKVKEDDSYYDFLKEMPLDDTQKSLS